jgi:hypothetical protein
VTAAGGNVIVITGMVGPGEEEAEEGRYRMVFKEITGPTRGEVTAGGRRGRRVSQGGSEVW